MSAGKRDLKNSMRRSSGFRSVSRRQNGTQASLSIFPWPGFKPQENNRSEPFRNTPRVRGPDTRRSLRHLWNVVAIGVGSVGANAVPDHGLHLFSLRVGAGDAALEARLERGSQGGGDFRKLVFSRRLSLSAGAPGGPALSAVPCANGCPLRIDRTVLGHLLASRARISPLLSVAAPFCVWIAARLCGGLIRSAGGWVGTGG